MHGSRLRKNISNWPENAGHPAAREPAYQGLCRHDLTQFGRDRIGFRLQRGTDVARQPTPNVAKPPLNMFCGADDGNRTRVFSLGSASKLNASCLRVGCFSWSRVVCESALVVRCCTVLHPVERCSRHELGTGSGRRRLGEHDLQRSSSSTENEAIGERRNDGHSKLALTIATENSFSVGRRRRSMWFCLAFCGGCQPVAFTGWVRSWV